MLIYEWNIVFLTIYAILCSLIPLQKIRRIAFIILSSGHLFIVQGLRSQFVGGDLPAYRGIYNNQNTISEVLNSPFEIGYSYLTYVLSEIGVNFQFFLIIVSFFAFVILSIFIYKYSAYPYISYLLYLFFGMYDFGFSGLRQVIAMSLILIAYQYLNSSKIFKFILTVLLAATFHVTSLFFLVVYIIVHHMSLRKLYWKFYPIVIGVILFFGDQIVYQATLWFNPALLNSYRTSFIDGFGMDEVLIILVFILGMYFYWRVPRLKDDTNFSNLFIITSLTLLFQLLSPYSYYFIRLNLYNYHFIMIFSTMLIKLIIDSVVNREIYIRFFVKFAIFAVILLVMFNFYHSYLGTNPHLIVPHSFFWER